MPFLSCPRWLVICQFRFLGNRRRFGHGSGGLFADQDGTDLSLCHILFVICDASLLIYEPNTQYGLQGNTSETLTTFFIVALIRLAGKYVHLGIFLGVDSEPSS